MGFETLFYQRDALLGGLAGLIGPAGAAFGTYLFEAGVFMGFFFLMYRLLMARERFYRFNRVVLLSAMGLSFLLPFCVFRERVEVAGPAYAFWGTGLPGETSEMEVGGTDRGAALFWGVWCCGAAVFLARRCVVFVLLARLLLRAGKRRLPGGLVLAVSPDAGMAFSIARYVVIPENLEKSKDFPMIFSHEAAHVRSGHSYDLLLAGLAGCLQWFNPFCHLLRKELQAVHEYEADAYVLSRGADAGEYSLLLIREAAGMRSPSLVEFPRDFTGCANGLNRNQLKKRIKNMMNRKEIRQMAKAKVLWFLPVMAAGMLLFGQKEYVYAAASSAAGDETAAALQAAAGSVRVKSSDDSRAGDSVSDSSTKGLPEADPAFPEAASAVADAVLDALDLHIQFEIDGKKVGLSELVEGVQSGLYDKDNLEKAITAFRILDDEGSRRLDVSFDGNVAVWDEDGGAKFMLTTIGKPDSTVPVTKSSSSVSVSRGNGGNTMAIYVDGKEVDVEEASRLSPDGFFSVVANGDEDAKAFWVTTAGEAGSESGKPYVTMIRPDGSVVVVNGNDVRDGAEAVGFYVDGKAIPDSEMQDWLKPEHVKHVRVEKDEASGKTSIHITLNAAGRKAMKTGGNE